MAASSDFRPSGGFWGASGWRLSQKVSVCVRAWIGLVRQQFRPFRRRPLSLASQFAPCAPSEHAD
eukprot:8342471-Alexandrium_andersonii.AAC.1